VDGQEVLEFVTLHKGGTSTKEIQGKEVKNEINEAVDILRKEFCAFSKDVRRDPKKKKEKEEANEQDKYHTAVLRFLLRGDLPKGERSTVLKNYLKPHSRYGLLYLLYLLSLLSLLCLQHLLSLLHLLYLLYLCELTT
jgi:hypothetical protein